MVIHTQLDWRTPDQGLEWDLGLVRSVFWRICRNYDAQSQAKLTRARQRQHQEDNQDDTGEARAVLSEQLDDNRLVAKADVLMEIKNAELYLDKRPFLRSLYTQLACCSNENEMESVANYVKYRLRERTISYSMVKAKLEKIYRKHVDFMAFEAKIQEFKAAARAQSTWCVRDYKAICRSPSQFYGIHNIPPKPKTQKQIDMENQLTRSHAVAVVNNAVSLVVSQVMDATRPKSRHRFAKSSRRNSASRPQHASEVAAAKAKIKRDRQEADVKRRELRLQVFVPGILSTMASASIGSLDACTDDEEGINRRKLQVRHLELLALLESNGDVAIAQQLLHSKILRSGFARASEHLFNLQGSSSEKAQGSSDRADEWTLVKLWKTVYRNRTLQAIQDIEQL